MSHSERRGGWGLITYPKTSSHGAGLASHIRSAHPNRHSSAPASCGAGLAGGLKRLVARLDTHGAAIDRALTALRGIASPGVADTVAAPAAAKKTAAKRRRGITPEGRRRLAEAMKSRWAVKRTAAQAKKSARPRKAA
jgi:hypothetical protein